MADYENPAIVIDNGSGTIKAGFAGDDVDLYFAKKATADAKPQQYLETVEFQLALLANLGAGSEDQFLLANLKRIDETAELMGEQIKTFLDSVQVRTDKPRKAHLLKTMPLMLKLWWALFPIITPTLNLTMIF